MPFQQKKHALEVIYKTEDEEFENDEEEDHDAEDENDEQEYYENCDGVRDGGENAKKNVEGTGRYWVIDDQTADEDDDARALRYDSWCDDL